MDGNLSGEGHRGPFEGLHEPYKVNPRVDLDPEGILQLIQNRGLPAVWETASRCPCGSPGDASGKLGCPICDGSGWEFHHAQEILVLVTGARRDINLAGDRVGQWEPGTVSMTVRAEFCPSFMDRITLKESFMRISELTIRPLSGATTQRLRYPIRDAALTIERDRTTMERVTVVNDVVHLRPGKPNGMPGDPLERGLDFRVLEDGRLDWTPGDARHTAPEPGIQFAITYYTNPTFRVRSYVHQIRDTPHGKKVPRPIMLRLPVNFIALPEHLATAKTAEAQAMLTT